MYHLFLKNKTLSSLTSFKQNLKITLDGLANLRTLPSAAFFNSTRRSFWGTGEAAAMKISSAGITDSDASPVDLLYTLPGNDDAFGSIYFFNLLVAKTVLISKIKSMYDFV